MSPSIHVIEIDVMAEGNWSWDDDGRLTWRPGRDHGWGHTTTFDPTAGYRVDRESVDAAVARALACWQPAWDVDLFMTDREFLGRSNAFSSFTRGKRPCSREGCDCGDTAVR